MIRTHNGKGTTLVEYWADERGPASGLESLPLTMYFGGARIPIGGIASVFTEEAHRNRGYARQCMEHAIELQRADGALISFLFAIPCFYEPFGYTVVMPWYAMEVPLSGWKRLPDEPALREALPSDRAVVDELYEAIVGERTGPLSRDRENAVAPTKPVRWRTSAITSILTDSRRGVRGYVCHSEVGAGEFEVVEAGARDAMACEALLAYLLHETARRGKERFVAALPPDDPFAMYLRRIDARFIVQTRPSGGGMARVLDLAGLCNALELVFARRVSALGKELVPARLTLTTESGNAEITLLGSGPAARLETSLSVMTRMLFGYTGFNEALAAAQVQSLNTAAGEALFPTGYPFMYMRDRF